MTQNFVRRLVGILVAPPVVFFLLALAVMGPLLLPGHILTLDSPLALNWDTDLPPKVVPTTELELPAFWLQVPVADNQVSYVA